MVVRVSEKSESYPSVSIVIVNFNGRELLKQCLLTLSKTDYSNYEIVVVDNASTDGSLTEIKKSFGSDPHIKLVENSENVGHAEGCNIGAQMTKGRYLVFLDSDTEFNAEWAATYGSKEERLKETFEILAASSGCCIVRRDVFNQVGGFDADYFIYDDDTDLSLRARLLGYRVLFVPSALVIHRGGVLRGITSSTLYHSSKNRVRTVLKNYELRNVWWRFSVLTFFTFMVSVGFLALKKNDEAKATMKGLVSSIKDFQKIWKKRLLLQSKRCVRDFELVNKGFIRNDFRSTLQDFRIKLKYMR
jgi:GT2 family glycosyltransferase